MSTDRLPPPNSTKRGSLVIAGSGIASLGQMTLDTISHLEKAERVFYLVVDPVTEAYIQEKNGNNVNLSVYYDTTKQRYRSYVEMAEVMLRAVRAGQRVLGLFYGHPGFFATPSHRALTLARAEGYEARMLPGISSFDCMIADLEFEPGLYGCTIHEATDLLARDRQLDPQAHNIILQPIAAGVTTLQDEPENSKFQLLVALLIQIFGQDHKVTLYTGAVSPLSSSAMVVYTLENLRNEQIAREISSRSSLYIPPRDIRPLSSSRSDELQLHEHALPLLGTPPVWEGSKFVNSAPYGPLESLFVSELDQHVTPISHKPLRASPAMKKFMIDLALDEAKQKDLLQNPFAVACSIEDLTDFERTVLIKYCNTPKAITYAMREPGDLTEAKLVADLAVYGTDTNEPPAYSIAF
ncbi:unnamed protein product [Rhizoctonia solani]|uniref:Tetrapyrrole methylase domain-containing protein n=1 Tax=Rhizoctonia solani TaxID=456999 RepID=A0A8H3BP90_9AGAM|nr:unnamed protein product [Rhizoctonia solani]